MRLIALAAFAGLLANTAHADTMQHCASAWAAKSAGERASTNYRAFSTMCMAAGYRVPVPSTPPPNVTARCNDGSYSMSKRQQGRCSGHGGVAKVL